MRQKTRKVLLATCAAILVGAPGALAATPADIYRDLADNGELNGTYTRAEMRAFLQNAPVQGYGNAVVTPGAAVVTLGAADAAAADPVDADVVTVGALPFTGADLGVLGAVGGLLLVGGVLLRVSARKIDTR
jgi:hypothetical protein